MKQNAKKCAIGATECNEIISLYVRKTEKRKKGWGRERRERNEKGSTEKRKETKGN